ncbi:hypothetical protein GCM10010300_40710 [Streptomyces olivaceoviridis]|nr:hypothetical protein GCM10010300_40710 [Streptomyces olivaceoviridis]
MEFFVCAFGCQGATLGPAFDGNKPTDCFRRTLTGEAGRSRGVALMHGDDGLPSTRWQYQLAQVESLSERERQVFSLLGAGLSNRAIAVRLRVTERTVKAHVASILAKLKVESRLQVGLVAQAHLLMYEGTVPNRPDVTDN